MSNVGEDTEWTTALDTDGEDVNWAENTLENRWGTSLVMQWLRLYSQCRGSRFYPDQGKPFNITVIQVYTPTSNAEKAEV